MTDNSDFLLNLAGEVSDGKPVDWAALSESPEAASSPGLLEEMAILARVGEVHRTLGGPDSTVECTGPGDSRPTWGPLTLQERIGEGAFGEVFRARDNRLDREVALKLLRPARTDQTAEDATATIEEGRLLARVRHRNVVTVYGAERIDGVVGVWTEFIHGRTLAALVRQQGRFGPQEAAAIGVDLCRALAAVHGAGLLHRDIKPQNVMREEGGRLVLMDFGAGREQLHATISEPDGTTGTPLYLAPELWSGGEATPQSDIYSLGVLLYHLVTGDYPARGKTVADVRESQLSGRHVLLRDARPDLPDAFVDAVERAIATDARERYDSAGTFEAALKAPQGPLEPAASMKSELIEPAVAGRRLAIGRTGIVVSAVVISAAVLALLLEDPLRNRVLRLFGGAVDRASPVVQTTRLPQLEMGRPSRDGRFLPYVDVNGDLQIWERATGRSRRAVEKGSSGESVLASAMSPTGDRVAYGVSTTLGWELRVVNADGTSPNILIAHERVFTPVPMAWSQDGRDLLCKFQQQDSSMDLALVPSGGGAPRLLKTFHGAAPGPVSLSSDGRYVIYYLPPDPKVPTRDLFILGTDGSAPRVLLAAQANDGFPMWTPDAQRVFFMRDSPTFNGSKDGWILSVVNGVAEGDPTRVLSNLGPTSWLAALTDSSALLYMLPTKSTDVYTSSFDLTGTTLPGPPTRISATAVGHHVAPAFSPNGQTIAYFTTRDPPARTVPVKTLTIQDRRTGHEQEVPAQLSYLEGALPRWMPDSVHVVVYGRDLIGHPGYFKVDTRTGETVAILLSDQYDGAPRFACLPDGRTLLYIAQRKLIARDLESGAERVLFAVQDRGWSGISRLAVSPHGDRLAFVATTDQNGDESDSLEVQPLMGPPRELVRVHFPERLAVHTWTPDGHGILFGRIVFDQPVGAGTERPMTLWRIEASGGEPQDMHLQMGSEILSSVALAPDGHLIAYGEGTSFWQLLAVDQFLPPIR